MSEITGKMSAKEIALATGFVEPVAKGTIDRPFGTYDVVDKKYQVSVITPLTEAVIDSRFAGRHEGSDPTANIELKAERRGLKLSAVEESSFIVNLKKEEELIAAGGTKWESHVQKFLGGSSVEAAVGVVGREATGSMGKLERMKKEAATDFASMQELATKVGEPTVIAALAKIKSTSESLSLLPSQKDDHFKTVTTELMAMDEKRFNKIVKKLGLDPKSIDFSDSANVEASFDMIADGLRKKAERTDDGSDVKKGVKIRQMFRGFGKDNAVVQRWVNKQIELDNKDNALNDEFLNNGDNFRALTEMSDKFSKKLTRIANREKVNKEISIEAKNKVGESQGLFDAAKVKKEQDDLMQLQVEHNKKVEASRELVASNLQLKELRDFAKNQSQMAESTVVAIGKTNALNGERDAMLNQIAEAKMPEGMKDVFGGEAYKAVEAFIESNGQKGDPKLVTDFLDQVKGMMGEKGTTVDDKEVTERAEFLKQTTVTIDGKSVDVGFVIGVATDDEGTYTISSAKRSEGGKPVVDSSSTLYLNHEKIRQYADMVSATETSIAFFQKEANVKEAGSIVALSEPVVGQIQGGAIEAMEVVKTAKITLAAQRTMLASALKPVGGQEKNFADALKVMSEAQSSVVEDLFNEARVTAYKDIAEKLGKTPAEITPAMLAITHVEAKQTAEKAQAMIDFLANHDKIMDSALEDAKPELQILAKQISVLEADSTKALAFESKAVRDAALTVVSEQLSSVNANAQGIAERIEASFVASTPDALKANGPEKAREALASKGIGDEARKLLADNNLSTIEVDAVLQSGEFDTGMTTEFFKLLVTTRDALGTLTTDSKSKVLQAALRSGKPDYMAPRIQEILKSQVDVENNLRTEATKSTESGKELGEMSGKEKAEAFLKGDVNQDAIVEAVATSSDVDAFFDKMDDLQLASPEGEAALEDFSSRVLEMLMKAEAEDASGEQLKALLEVNPENWSAILRRVFRSTDNKSSIRHAIDVAERIITEKKTV